MPSGGVHPIKVPVCRPKAMGVDVAWKAAFTNLRAVVAGSKAAGGLR